MPVSNVSRVSADGCGALAVRPNMNHAAAAAMAATATRAATATGHRGRGVGAAHRRDRRHQAARLGILLQLLERDLQVGHVLDATARMFFRQRLMRTSRSCGSGAVMVLMRGGSSRSTAAIVDIVVEPSNARRPVAISYSTDPNEKMSERASTTPPSACSGDM